MHGQALQEPKEDQVLAISKPAINESSINPKKRIT